MVSSIECEWQSMMPGITYLPVPSMMRAFGEALRFFPTAAILPLRRSTSVFCNVPRVTVSTVAFRISVSVCFWARTTVAGRVAMMTRRRSLKMNRFIVYSVRKVSRKGAKADAKAQRRNSVWLAGRATSVVTGRLYVHRASIDEDVRDVAIAIEQIPAHDCQVCDLSGFDRTELILDTQDFRRPDRERA